MKQELQTRKQDFPIFTRLIHDKPLIYLDNAATTHQPNQVLEIVNEYYKKSHSNVHRGVHTLSEEATMAYEGSRIKIANFINATKEETIFTKNASESLNLAANILKSILKEDDEIVVTQLEHHSNFVPLQQIAKQTGCKFKVWPVNENGELDQSKNPINEKTKILGLTYISNALGTINPVKEIIKQAHDNQAYVILDAAQAVPHIPVDVKELNTDFLAFSGHKMCGPTGIGVLYGKKELLEKLPPFLFGGDMIREVKEQETTWNDLPHKYEAGTPNISGAIGLAASIEYLSQIGMKNIQDYETKLTEYLKERLKELDYIKAITPKNQSGIISFNIDGVHAHDVASILDLHGIQIRGGHHCAMPLMRALNLQGTARVSIYFYNTYEDIDNLILALEEVRKTFQ